MGINPSALTAKAVSLRLRTHYLVLAIGLSIIPVLLIVLLTRGSLEERLTKLDDRSRAEITHIVSSNLIARFDLLRSKLYTLADMPPVSGLIRAQDGLGVDVEQGISAEIWSERFTAMLRAFGTNDRSIRSLRLVSQNERLLAREEFRDGVVLPAEGRAPYESSEDPAFLNTYRMAEGRVYVSQLLRPGPRARTSPQESFISVAVPVRFQGRARAVMIVDAQASVLLQELSGVVRSADVILADSQGHYVAVGELAKTGQANAASLFADWPGLDPRKLDVPQYSTSQGRELSATLVDVNPGGVASFWMLGMIKNGSAVAATLHDITSVVAQWTLVFLLLVVSLALLIADHKRKLFLQLLETLHQVRNGNATARVPAKGKDELSEVARGVNDMLDAVQTNHKSLFDARILAAEGARAKAMLFANLCKEIGAPMGTVHHRLDELGQTSLDAEQSEAVHSAASAVKVLANALNDAMDYARIEAGQLTIENTTFDLRRLTEECVEVFEQRAQERGLTLASTLPADLPVEVVGDAGRIRQVLMCFLANAVKRTSSGEIALTLRTRVEQGGRYAVRFDIQDGGAPLADDERRGLFTPQARLEVSPDAASADSGLGLSISQRLMELMNGEVGVENNQGCVFWFEVPLRSAEGRAPMPPVLSDMPSAPEPNEFAGVRVLLVEDNLVNQQIALYSMKRMGAEVVTAANGRVALEILAGQEFDLILMDCHMPEMDGFDATREIREKESTAGAQAIPIIAMTTNALPGERERCLAAGMNECLAKPFDQDQLRALLHEWARRRNVDLALHDDDEVASTV